MSSSTLIRFADELSATVLYIFLLISYDNVPLFYYITIFFVQDHIILSSS